MRQPSPNREPNVTRAAIHIAALAAVLFAGAWAGQCLGAVTIYDLGTLGETHSYGNGINASGQVVGFSQVTGNVTQHAFLYTGTPGSGGAMADLGPGAGNAINASGQITGSSAVGGVVVHAFLYTGTP